MCKQEMSASRSIGARENGLTLVSLHAELDARPDPEFLLESLQRARDQPLEIRYILIHTTQKID
jgi:hypothetical protein